MILDGGEKEQRKFALKRLEVRGWWRRWREPH